jgi:pyruvate,water dikinase
MFYPRRAEDPSIDYRAFTMLLGSEPGELDRRAEETNRQRIETAERVRAALAAQPDGELKVSLFTTAHDLALEYLLIRDQERFRPTDVYMYSFKRGFAEIGRRLLDRGLIDEEMDFHYFSEWELYDLFLGRISRTELLDAKIQARRLHCERMLAKTANLPMYLRRNHAVDLDQAAAVGVEGVYPGSATSSGVVIATARVVQNHHEMTRVQPGEILVTHSTDPGWNPVFGVIKAVVVETGGVLSHASCLAREYGFPAVHLPGTTRLIPDGATITVNGDTGTITVVDSETAR